MALAAHYRETLQQLEELERGIEHAFVVLSEPIVAWVLHDLTVLERARSEMEKAHRRSEAVEKGNRKNERAERKEKNRAKRNKEKRTGWQAPVGRGDAGSSRTHIIEIRGQETEPNIQLSDGMKKTVNRFIALNRHEFSGRLRDLMSELFGEFECPATTRFGSQMARASNSTSSGTATSGC